MTQRTQNEPPSVTLPRTVKFVQISATPNGLYGLDEFGRVWMPSYSGENQYIQTGWTRLTNLVEKPE